MTFRKPFLTHSVEFGDNFVDTADVYSGGSSEELLGRFIAMRKLRDDIVLASKYSFNGGNGRKNLQHSIEASLKRLGTDYLDLYWVHVWDAVTPAEELLQSRGDLIRAGKIRYFGLSDVPAWYATRIRTLAQVHNVPGPIAFQLPYSLVERSIEQEHIPCARARHGTCSLESFGSWFSDRQIQPEPGRIVSRQADNSIATISPPARSKSGTGKFLTNFERSALK